MTDNEAKLCKTCKQVRPLSAFYREQWDDYVHECLLCRLVKATGQTKVSPPLFNTEQALLEVTLLNAETSTQCFDDVVSEGIRRGIALEILTRMEKLWEVTKEISGEVIHIGKIIIMKIVDFLKAHPRLAASLALGAAVYLLVNAIPFIGPFLAPLLSAIAAIYAYSKDTSFDEVLKLANDFFQLLVDIFNTVTSRWAKA